MFGIDDAILIPALTSLVGSIAGSASAPKQPKNAGQAQSNPTMIQPTQFAIPQVSSQEIAQLMQLLGQTRQQAPTMPGMGAMMKPPARSLF